ncbi:MAG TPA: prolyl oligopeptidase family serine peptidase [Gemmatimonadaceae bacterium]
MSCRCSPGALALLAGVAGTLSAQSAPQSSFHYPDAKRVEQVDDYHGVRIADPYRWLEDTDSPETKRWVEEENALTSAYLAGIPERAQLEARLTTLWNYPKYGVPIKRGDLYVFSENSGLQNQPVLYAQRKLDGKPVAILDPNTLSTDGTVALSAWDVSENGRYLAYAISASGSDWQEIHVRDIEHGKDLRDVLRWVKFSGIAWTKDGRGFFYARYAEPSAGGAMRGVNKNQRLYYHRVGHPQSDDELIWDDPNEPDWLVSAQVSDDGRFALLTLSKGTDTRNQLYFIDLVNPGKPKVTNPVVTLLDQFDASYAFIDNWGPVFFIHTDLDAPRGRVIAIDINAPRRTNWRTVIPESRDVLRSVALIGGEFAANYLHDASSRVRFFSLAGQPAGELALPGLGTVDEIRGKPDEPELFYDFVSFLQPRSVFHFDVKRRAVQPFRVATVAFDASAYETKQVFATSKDGTRVPIFITARKGVKLDGRNPVLVYGYGGFDIPVTPSFSASRLVWLERGGIYAVVTLRGGGEYGKSWHEAGMFERKQNVFDDFIAAAEYLIAEKYTSSDKLAMQGGSNGGLLVGAVMTQRPELFAAAIPAVGVMDMLRFQRFTIGWAWTSEYGSSDDSTQFQYLVKYSPLHNLRPGTRYPATLVETSDHDDRVVPGHSFKFAATLQADQAGAAPVLIRVETKAGHGAGKPTSKVIELAADEIAFLIDNLDMRDAKRAEVTR